MVWPQDYSLERRPPGLRRGAEVFRGCATAIVVLLAIQAMGLQLLCFCGHCPASLALGWHADDDDDADADAGAGAGAELPHDCCAHALDDQAELLGVGQATSGGPCCGDAHQLLTADATAQDPRDLSVSCPLAVALLSPDFRLITKSYLGAQSSAWLWARGPPGAPATDLAIAQRRLLI